MPILNPEHLVYQAERLIEPPPRGRPRQIDLRRAVSAIYYALFHCAATALADEFVGARWRASNRYRLVYRSLEHKALRDVCTAILKPRQGSRYSTYFPAPGFGVALLAFADAVIELQQKRHTADYDPAGQYKTADAENAVKGSRGAIASFGSIPSEERQLFLTLLLCPPR